MITDINFIKTFIDDAIDALPAGKYALPASHAKSYYLKACWIIYWRQRVIKKAAKETQDADNTWFWVAKKCRELGV